MLVILFCFGIVLFCLCYLWLRWVVGLCVIVFGCYLGYWFGDWLNLNF